MTTPLDTTDTIYSRIVGAMLDTDDLPQFWD